MAAFSSMIAIAGLAVAAVGAGVSYYGATQQAAAQGEALALQKQQDALRNKQMNLDAMRRQREIVRQSVAARSVALSNSTAQNAQGGSGLQGGYGQISGRTNVNALGISQNQDIGNQMFGLNAGVYDAYRSAAYAGSIASLGSGLTSLGGMAMKNNVDISRVGASISSMFSSRV